VSGPAPLAADATSFTDGAALSGPAYFYWVFAVDAANVPIGSSSLVGFIANTRTGSEIPEGFHLQINRLHVATLKWSPSAQGTTTYMLVAVTDPFGESTERVFVLGGDVATVSDATSGVPTCYSLVGVNGVAIGRTDFLCVIPE
jgi:hypothetical protein